MHITLYSSLGLQRSASRIQGLAAAGMALGLWLAGFSLAFAQLPPASTAKKTNTTPTATAPLLAATMAHSCAACHGTLGHLSDESFAPLAGMPSEQFVRTMKDFREGRRPATLMGLVAMGFSDTDLKGMGDFFEAQKSLKPTSVKGK